MGSSILSHHLLGYSAVSRVVSLSLEPVLLGGKDMKRGPPEAKEKGVSKAARKSLSLERSETSPASGAVGLASVSAGMQLAGGIGVELV